MWGNMWKKTLSCIVETPAHKSFPSLVKKAVKYAVYAEKKRKEKKKGFQKEKEPLSHYP